jgi:two-component system, LytTR family, response regulator
MLQSVKYYPQPVIPVTKKEPLILLPLEKLRVDTVGQVYYFPVDDIVRIQSFSNYSKIFFSAGENILVAKVLARFEEQLSSSPLGFPNKVKKRNAIRGMGPFLRIHRSHLINKRYLLYYIPGTKAKVCLINGDKIPVSKRRKNIFRQVQCLR